MPVGIHLVDMEIKYKISGASRRNVKKKMNELKRMARMHYFYNDIDQVYGCGLNEKQSKEYLDKLDKQIKQYETQLNETI